jgi:hypothetical protein
MTTINETMTKIMGIDGAVCVAVVDAQSGMMLGSQGTGVDMEAAAAGNTEVVRAKLKTMKSLGLNDAIEDIMITLGKQYHIITLVPNKPGLFLYFVLDRAKANLALARRASNEACADIKL